MCEGRGQQVGASGVPGTVVGTRRGTWGMLRTCDDTGARKDALRRGARCRVEGAGETAIRGVGGVPASTKSPRRIPHADLIDITTPIPKCARLRSFDVMFQGAHGDEAASKLTRGSSHPHGACQRTSLPSYTPSARWQLACCAQKTALARSAAPARRPSSPTHLSLSSFPPACKRVAGSGGGTQSRYLSTVFSRIRSPMVKSFSMALKHICLYMINSLDGPLGRYRLFGAG